MEKYSVKKPYTVYVAAVVIIILGIVAYPRMVLDLFPQIDLPMIVVVTPYPGGNPEQVEVEVTQPLEETLATVENIENITSTSSNNSSMIMLEFQEDVDMDAASVDILQNINMVSGAFDEMVGSSFLLKMNPSMLPVATVAVSYEGMDNIELSTFLDEQLGYSIESIEGIASYTASGVVSERVNAVINQSKIDVINSEILSSVDSQIASGLYQMDVAIAQMKQGISETTAARETLEAQRQALADAGTPMPIEVYLEQMATIVAAEAELNSGLETLQGERNSLNSQADDLREAADLGSKITVEMITGLLQAQNFEMPAGYISESGQTYLISVGDMLNSVEEANSLFLFDSGVSSVGEIYLEDVADVAMYNNSDEVYTNVNGENGIILSLSKQSNIPTVEATDNMLERFEQLESEYDGLEFTSLMNQGDYIKLIVSTILDSLIWGALFAILILIVFLRSIRPTLITLISIPFSLIFALTLMYFSGVTINMISMSGLAVSVGMLVDNSIVVIENIYRLRKEGLDAKNAAIEGSKQVSGAITASTLTTISVFAPIIFVEGITRQLFTDMALTITYSLLASLIIATTLVPALSATVLDKMQIKEYKESAVFTSHYKKLITYALAHKAVVLSIVAVLFFGSLGISISRGFIFMPDMSSPQISVTVNMPEGSTLEETKLESEKIIEIISNIDEVKDIGGMLQNTSFMGMGSANIESISLFVMLDEEMDYDSNQIAKEIVELTADSPAEVVPSTTSSADFTAALGGEGMSIEVSGNDIPDMQDATIMIGEAITEVTGVGEVFNGLEETDTQLHFTVDKNAAMKNGVTVAQIYAAMAELLNNDHKATSVTWEGDSFEIYVSDSEKLSPGVDNITNANLLIEMGGGETKTININEVATLEERPAMRSINRSDQHRYIEVTAEVLEGYNITLVSDDARSIVDELNLPEGVSVEYAGENETIMEAMEQLLLLLVVGIIFVYLIMVAQFQSLKSPFIIMFTVPLSITGGLIALLVTGMEISIIAMIGFVMLSGIIVNNGIVLVDYINIRINSGMEKREAIISAAVTRLRPIMMTSLTTILGLSITGFGQSVGTEIMQPVALVCIGGLIYATLLTLIVIPVIYDLVNKGPVSSVRLDTNPREVTWQKMRKIYNVKLQKQVNSRTNKSPLRNL